MVVFPGCHGDMGCPEKISRKKLVNTLCGSGDEYSVQLPWKTSKRVLPQKAAVTDVFHVLERVEVVWFYATRILCCTDFSQKRWKESLKKTYSVTLMSHTELCLPVVNAVHSFTALQFATKLP